VSARSILLLIAIIGFVIAGLGLFGFSGINFLALGLAAFAGAFLVDEKGLRLR
jgi:hypothetical protein